MEKLTDNEIYLETETKTEANGDRPLAYRFHIRTCADGKRVGACSFRVGGPENRHIKYGGNIGYDIDEPFRGKKYSLKACKLLLRLAESHGLEIIFITCDPANIASRRICELLGASFVTILDLPEDDYNRVNHGTMRHCIYEMAVTSGQGGKGT